MAWLGLAMGIAFGSALVPFISIELFVIGMAAQEPQVSCLLLGLVVAIGQVGGKLLYYYAGRGSIRLPAFLHREARPMTARRERWHVRTKRLRSWVAVLRAKCERHPHWMVGAYSVSSVVGLPPYMATVVLAGLVRMRLATFISAGLAGRFIRFSLLAASPALFTGWLF
ncbi:YqaA family protein [Actinokineospora pegani]|uniref:hypothetical protein n=1 Tax=Actinokineospora pegani TaxID=2654637 RepID=UPI0012EAFA73|nr:hypothetical protein [Actinokineospora pegani]